MILSRLRKKKLPVGYSETTNENLSQTEICDLHVFSVKRRFGIWSFCVDDIRSLEPKKINEIEPQFTVFAQFDRLLNTVYKANYFGLQSVLHLMLGHIRISTEQFLQCSPNDMKYRDERENQTRILSKLTGT